MEGACSEHEAHTNYIVLYKEDIDNLLGVLHCAT